MTGPMTGPMTGHMMGHMTGWLPTIAVAVPAMGAVIVALTGRLRNHRASADPLVSAISTAVSLASLAVAVGMGVVLLRDGQAIDAPDAWWGRALPLRADGLSALMVLTTALIMPLLDLARRARARAGVESGSDTHATALFLGVWAALLAVFLGDNLFGLFAAMEILTLCAVGLICLNGSPELLRAGLRYLLFASLGSALYLLGLALMHGAVDSLDLTWLAGQHAADPKPIPVDVTVAVSLMTVGMLAKAGLFPLHIWLPAVHANAPPTVSAMHSALVIKGAFFVVLRLWIDLMREVPTAMPSQLLGMLGAMAIVVGSVVALRQERLKALIAWSTVAQVGYLFVVIPLVVAPVFRAADHPAVARIAITGAMLQAVSHAFAKAAMFLAAGAVARSVGHDRIAELRGVGLAMPGALIAFTVGGLSLMGLPPTGGFWAKWLLLSSAIVSGQWWWGLAMLAGGFLSAAYVWKVVSIAFDRSDDASEPTSLVTRHASSSIPLILALVSLLLGLMAIAPPQLVMVGRSVAGEVLP